MNRFEIELAEVYNKSSFIKCIIVLSNLKKGPNNMPPTRLSTVQKSSRGPARPRLIDTIFAGSILRVPCNLSTGYNFAGHYKQ